jgi:aldehyde:ferredoxin oxidoreductase
LPALIHRTEDIKQQGLATSAMQRLSSILVKFDESATATNLKEELTDFAQKWDRFKNSVPDEYLLQMLNVSVEDSFSEDSPHELSDDQVVNKSEELTKCKSCKKCPVCCFSVLHKYSFFGQTYKHLFSAYKLLLTLSSTQVACERSFSKLKYIKNRLRSSLSSTHLEAFMLMSIETDVLSELNNDTIIDHVAEMMPSLKKLLIL